VTYTERTPTGSQRCKSLRTSKLRKIRTVKHFLDPCDEFAKHTHFRQKRGEDCSVDHGVQLNVKNFFIFMLDIGEENSVFRFQGCLKDIHFLKQRVKNSTSIRKKIVSGLMRVQEQSLFRLSLQDLSLSIRRFFPRHPRSANRFRLRRSLHDQRKKRGEPCGKPLQRFHQT